jgi:hypothetical protein
MLAEELAERVKEHKKAMARLERSLRSLSGRWSDPRGVGKELEALSQEEFDLPAEIVQGVRELVDRGRDWLELEREDRRGRLARALKEGADGRGLTLALISREPLEIRLDPVGVAIDLEEARATLTFGREELAQCPADAEEILQARDKALVGLDRKGWTPEGFHGELRDAWLLATRMGKGEGWIELGEALPLLALTIQSKRWRLDPTSKNFTDYGKAQFLYDLHRLRSAGALTVDGWRLSLGPATGDSTRDKRRVFWVEDGEGRGSYCLTLRFVRDEEIHGSKL